MENTRSCLIEQLRLLKVSAKEAVGSIQIFSEFQEYMHVSRRKIEEELWQLIVKANESDKSQLVLVCGGVGYGKSHLLSHYNKYNQDIMSNFKIINDATESLEPTKTDIETLNEILVSFSDEKINCSKDEKIILAINLGVLSNFIDSEFKDNYSLFRQYVIDSGILESQVNDDSFDENSNFQFINLSDYNIFTLTKEGVDSDYITKLINKVTKKDDKNDFYKTYTSNCENKCKCSKMCPVKFNYELLMNEVVQKKLINLLVEGILKYKLIISTRALLNFIYDIIVANNIDKCISNEKIIDYILNLKFDNYIQCLMPNLIFEHEDMSNIFAVLSQLDPMHCRTEEMDELSIKFNTQNTVLNLFDEYAKLDNNSYVYKSIDDIDKSEELNSNSIACKNDLLKLLVRIHKFSNIDDKLKIVDEVYNEYVQNLYFWNKGSRRAIRKLYVDVIDAIYNWCGKSNNGYINLSLGKKQLRYNISEKFEVEPFLENLIEISDDEIHRFIPYLKLSFKKVSAEQHSEIAIDFLLYELLMRIRDGYRPNKKDRNNFIKFVEFIEQLAMSGDNNEEIIFEEIGEELNRYKLRYEKNFNEYSFEGV